MDRSTHCHEHVSIPFKRESVSQADNPTDEQVDKMVAFQFPSNGKAYHKKPIATRMASSSSVSIPFKRESVSQDFRNCQYCRSQRQVSIPFKRESVSQEFQGVNVDEKDRPVSIPFKRESVSQAMRCRYARCRFHVSIPFKRESVSQVAFYA